jgi:hypothetical protein
LALRTKEAMTDEVKEVEEKDFFAGSDWKRSKNRIDCGFGTRSGKYLQI